MEVIPITPELWIHLAGQKIHSEGKAYFPDCIDQDGRYISMDTYNASDNPYLLAAKPIITRPHNPFTDLL